VWNLDTGFPIHVLKAHDSRVNSVSLLSDGRYALSASDDSDINLWDLTSGVLLATHTTESPVLACAGNPRELNLIAGDRSGLVHFISLEGSASNPDHA
jgi:WD40 repeat protein